jgi:hypothetical protein
MEAQKGAAELKATAHKQNQHPWCKNIDGGASRDKPGRSLYPEEEGESVAWIFLVMPIPENPFLCTLIYLIMRRLPPLLLLVCEACIVHFILFSLTSKPKGDSVSAAARSKRWCVSSSERAGVRSHQESNFSPHLTGRATKRTWGDKGRRNYIHKTDYV